MIFAGLLVAAFFVRMEKKARMILTACLLFVMPAFLYSVAISCVTGKVVILSDATVRNPSFAAGLDVSVAPTAGEILTDPKYKTLRLAPGAFGAGEGGDPAKQSGLMSRLLHHIMDRSIGDVVKSIKKQIYNLWTPNTFATTRVAGLSSHPRSELWSYGISHPQPWVYLITGAYITLSVLGVAGICLCPGNIFKLVAVVALASLCSLGVVTFLCSRFRLPFVFIFAIYAARLLSRPGETLANLRSPPRVFLLLILLRVFTDIVLVKMDTIGAWG